MGASWPVTFFSPWVMSDTALGLTGSLACFWAWAVGPPLTGRALPVSSFSALVMLEMVSESSLLAAMVLVAWMLREMMGEGDNRLLEVPSLAAFVSRERDMMRRKL